MSQQDAVGTSRIRIGISACLLGQEVRFDGGHKRNDFLTDVLGPHVEWVPVCPEVEMGLGTPREPLRLVRTRGARGLRMITVRTGVDHTDGMNDWASERLDDLARGDGLCGYVLKKDSPSCGMVEVKTFGADGTPRRGGRGLFASALLDRFPLLPVEEEGRLADAGLRENFVERIFASRRLKDLFVPRWTIGALVRFHAAHEMQLLSHSAVKYRELGRLVANAAALPKPAVRASYEQLFMETLAVPATPRRHVNVLMHMLGHLKKHLDAESRQDVLRSIEDYRLERVPRVVPLALLRRHVLEAGVEYLDGQTYFNPYPQELRGSNER